MSISYIPEQNEYKEITPFKRFILQSFPWIDANFDALTNYELMGKIIEYLNDVIANENTLESNMSNLYDSFVLLHNYVENYFDNLDVQDEINNKLDSLVEDGTMAEIINQELLGNINTYISKDATLQLQPTIFVGDSYLLGVGTDTNYGDIYKTLTGLSNSNYYKFASAGAGFYATGSGGKTYLQVLTENASNVTNKTDIKQIIVGCGFNDAQYGSTFAQMQSAIESFCNYCKTNYPNAVVYIMACGYSVGLPFSVSAARFNLAKQVLDAYSHEGYTNPPIFINGSNLWLHNTSYMQDDTMHPNASGQGVIARKLMKALRKDYYNEFINAHVTATIFGNSFTINGDIKEQLYHLWISSTQGWAYTEGNYKTLTNGAWTEIGTFASNYLHPMDNASCIIPINFEVITANSPNEYFNLNGFLRLNAEGKIHLMFNTYINNQKSNITNIRRLNINPFFAYVNSYEN